MQYDYIIIGAGSAGCVLANRLSTNPRNNILLLESGGKDNISRVRAPAAFPTLFKTKYSYNYYTQPMASMNNRQLYLPRGKMLGGCSSSNAMVYIRGAREDYDEWSALGNSGWSYEEVLPYFKKAEHQERITDAYHGQDGPLNVTDLRYHNLLSETFIEAGLELGYAKNEDFNGAQQAGFGHYQVTQKDGARCSTAKAYLHPIAKRPNLTIITKANVDRIVIDNGVAIAVEYSDTQQHRITAHKEIIICAGAYNSPQLLQCSGIGDSSLLKSLNIKVAKHLPGVGQNLQDHMNFLSNYDSTYKKSLDSVIRFPHIYRHLLHYWWSKKGALSSNLAESGAFIKSSPELTACDIQLHFIPSYCIDQGFSNPAKGCGFSITGTILNPSSRGSVTYVPLQDAPNIDHNYMSTEDDIRRAIWGYKLTQKIGLSETFKPYCKGLCVPKVRLEEDADIEEHLRATSQTLYHPTSTCKMGVDNMAVVDPQLKVHGIEQLRVVDASIMPNVIRGNTNAPTIMIAEKAADMILGN